VPSTAGESIIASNCIRLSWVNAGRMLVALVFTCAWWMSRSKAETLKTETLK